MGNNVSDLNQWSRGDPFKADHLNEAIKWLKNNGEVVGGPGLGVTRGNNGTIISPLGTAIHGRWFIGKITGIGPAGEADYTDNRYWVTAQQLSPTGDETALPQLDNATSLFGDTDDTTDPDTGDTSTSYINIGRVTNLAEQKDATHNLRFGDYVFVWEIFEEGSPPAASDDTQQSGDNESSPVSRWIMFVPDVGRGQYQSMVLSTVSQNQRGWDFVRAHPALT